MVSLSATVTGCLGLGGGDDGVSTEGDDDSPFDTSPESLLPDAETLTDKTDREWREGDAENGFGREILDNESILRDKDAVALFRPVPSGEEDVGLQVCASTVRLYDTVEEARKAFDDSPFQFGFGYESRSIAVEAIGGTANNNDSQVIFRDANAIGNVVFSNSQASVDEQEQTALDLAAAMHESWR
ncbi:hypothetical protein SAMN05216226_103216 [Halovenus aranensis]|uniref:Uncharacterized protein n=1 Tax=Halovenus aranensis TaxID=890420 RepID=A0A1G8TTK2_9EURY|nr:hypothetical protein [Halovenus aranensis]SDJ44265.1 hypothetical protein SAMN05216226_103216 [Halovenus aranensis]